MRFDREKFDCPVHEISAYIDGELDAVREGELEAHFESCADCAADLNLQKQFLCELNMRLRDGDEVKLPVNFAKRIVVNAESSVNGLRPARERYNAVFICAGLLLFALFAMGAEAGKLIQSGLETMERTAAVGGFLGHVAYSVVLGVVVVMRSFASQVHVGDLAGMALAVFLCVSIAVISRRFLRAARV